MTGYHGVGNLFLLLQKKVITDFFLSGTLSLVKLRNGA